MSYDSKGATLEHIQMVQRNINDIIRRLMERAQTHDSSKLESPVKEVFDEWTPRLSGVTYGSEEYREMLVEMRPAIDHHQQNNRHHPEYFGDRGVTGMDLVDLIEMICDWKAATLRHDDGDIFRSLEINVKRFNISADLVEILRNTIVNMMW